MTRNDSSTDEIVQEMDETLPDGVDRRKFVAGAVATLLGAPMAGCLGDDDDDEPADDGDDAVAPSDDDDDAPAEADIIDKNVTWRQPWRVEPTWSMEHIADFEGFWLDHGVTAPNVQAGFGSDDTARRVGTGEEEIGLADIGAATPGLAEGFDLKVVAVARPRTLFGLFYRRDRLDDHTDIEGKDVMTISGFADAAWPIYPDTVGVDIDDVNKEFISEDLAPSELEAGNFDAGFGSVDIVGNFRQVMDDDNLGLVALNSLRDLYGNPLFVNGEWYENQDDGQEYMTRIISGYSHALKWCLLNKDEALDILVNDLNQDLQAWEEDRLQTQMEVAMAFSVTEETKENGVGWYDVDALDDTLEAYSVVTDNPEDVPNADDIVIDGIIENANLATFSDDEWETVQENAGEFWEIYEPI